MHPLQNWQDYAIARMPMTTYGRCGDLCQLLNLSWCLIRLLSFLLTDVRCTKTVQTLRKIVLMISVLIRLYSAMWVCREAEQNQSECVNDLARLRELDGTVTALLHVPASNTALVLRSNYGDIPTRVLTVRAKVNINEQMESEVPIIFVIPEDHL
jgi:hypothetical protein